MQTAFGFRGGAGVTLGALYLECWLPWQQDDCSWDECAEGAAVEDAIPAARQQRTAGPASRGWAAGLPLRPLCQEQPTPDPPSRDSKTQEGLSPRHAIETKHPLAAE